MAIKYAALTYDLDSRTLEIEGPYDSLSVALMAAEAEAFCSGMVEGGNRRVIWKAAPLPLEEDTHPGNW